MKIVIELKDMKDVAELFWAVEMGGLAVEHDWSPLLRRAPGRKTSKAQKGRTKSVVKRVTKQLCVKNIKILEP